MHYQRGKEKGGLTFKLFFEIEQTAYLKMYDTKMLKERSWFWVRCTMHKEGGKEKGGMAFKLC